MAFERLLLSRARTFILARACNFMAPMQGKSKVR
jgi:hypothetical protein